jgi:glycosyltransferase involved in cell wall biosynthesis
MVQSRHLTFVVPCYNEERLLARTVTTLPPFVDAVILVNDCSTDRTLEVMHELACTDPRVRVVQNPVNAGVGASVVRGFREALTTSTDLIGVIAGDAQCDPAFIRPLADTLIANGLGYAKGNRFKHVDALRQMPRHRRIGNTVVSHLTKVATGLHHIFDSQNGYGIFTRGTLEAIELSRIGRRYDYESTLLLELAIANIPIRDVPIPAMYGDETSTIPLVRTTLRTLWVLHHGFWRRQYHKLARTPHRAAKL